MVKEPLVTILLMAVLFMALQHSWRRGTAASDAAQNACVL